MTSKITRRELLTGGTAALAFDSIATGASAQTYNLDPYIKNSVDSFYQVIQRSNISNTLVQTLEFISSNQQAFREDRIRASGVLATLQVIKDGRFHQLSQNDQLDVMRCTLNNTGRTIQYMYSVAKGRDDAVGTVQTGAEVRAMRQNYNIIRRADNALDPLFRGRNESCSSIWSRTIGNVRYRPS